MRWSAYAHTLGHKPHAHGIHLPGIGDVEAMRCRDGFTNGYVGHKPHAHGMASWNCIYKKNALHTH